MSKFIEQITGSIGESSYAQWGLRYNPFSRSGIAKIGAGDDETMKLEPLHMEEVKEFVVASLRPGDDFISCSITGDYGTGKTQFLMYVRTVLRKIAEEENEALKPYVVYIPNPGVKLSELLGTIIYEIGEENLKRYLWNRLFEKLRNSEEDKNKVLQSFRQDNNGTLFEEEYGDIFSTENSINYKQFLDVCYKKLRVPVSSSRAKPFREAIKEILLRYLQEDCQDSVIAHYFYNFITSHTGINTAWEDLTSGEGKHLHRKATQLLKEIITIVKNHGYTHFILLVDEFEDLTLGRLSKALLDNYLYNLRILVDNTRNWSLMLAMLEEGEKVIGSVSPALSDRLGQQKIKLERSDKIDDLKKIITNILSIASVSKETVPNIFEDAVIMKIAQHNKGILRLIIKDCYFLLEKMRVSGKERINEELVNSYYNKDHGEVDDRLV